MTVAKLVMVSEGTRSMPVGGHYHQDPITQREGALNLCMYADSTCCQMALAQNSLYGKCYVRHYMECLVAMHGRCHSTTGGITVPSIWVMGSSRHQSGT